MKVKELVFDIETAPLTTYAWGLHEQNLNLGLLKKDWSILAWAGKWRGEPSSKIQYMDNRQCKDPQDDKAIVIGLWKLLNQADIVITQNGDKFDIKKFNARAVMHGLPPVKPFKSTDLLKESRKVFSFTSHSLEYLSRMFNVKYKKLKHKKFPGFELWKAVLAGNKQAWAEMRKYCIHDVLSTEELFERLRGWIKTQNLAVYYEDDIVRCRCGSTNLVPRGYARTDTGKFRIYHCKECGKWPRGAENLLSTEKKKALLKEKS